MPLCYNIWHHEGSGRAKMPYDAENRKILAKCEIIPVTRFGGRGLGRPTFRQTCTSVTNHEDMDSLFPFLTKWEAHIIQLNSFLVQYNKIRRPRIRTAHIMADLWYTSLVYTTSLVNHEDVDSLLHFQRDGNSILVPECKRSI